MNKRFDQFSKLKPVLALFFSAYLGLAISYSKFYLFHLVFIIFLFLATSCVFFDFSYYKKKSFFVAISLAVAMPFVALIARFNTPHLKEGIYYATSLALNLGIVWICYCYKNSVFRLSKIYKLIKTLFFIELFLALLESFALIRFPISSYSLRNYFFSKGVGVDLKNHPEWAEYFSTSPSGFRWNANNYGLLITGALPFLSNSSFMGYMVWLSSLFTLICTGSRLCFIIGLFYTLYLAIRHHSSKHYWIRFFLFLFLPISLYITQGTYHKKAREIVSIVSLVSISLPEIQQPISFNLEAPHHKREDIKGLNSTGLRVKLFNLMVADLNEIKTFLLGKGPAAAYYISKGGVKRSPHLFPMELLYNLGFLYILLLLYVFYRLIRVPTMDETHNSLKASLTLLVISSPAISSAVYFLPLGLVMGWLSIYLSKQDQIDFLQAS